MQKKAVVGFYGLACLMAILCASLSHWQWQRGQTRAQWQSHLTSSPQLIKNAAALRLLDEVPYTHANLSAYQVSVDGQLSTEYSFLLEGKYHQQQLGYHLVSVFELGDGTRLLVQRGWCAADDCHAIAAQATTPRRLTGRVMPVPSNVLWQRKTFSCEAWPCVLPHLTKPMLHQLGLGILPYLIELPPNDEDLLVPLPSPTQWLSPERHYGYAIQWALLCMVCIAGIAFFYRHSTRTT